MQHRPFQRQGLSGRQPALAQHLLLELLALIALKEHASIVATVKGTGNLLQLVILTYINVPWY
jgi:hypothetical protein